MQKLWPYFCGVVFLSLHIPGVKSRRYQIKFTNDFRENLELLLQEILVKKLGRKIYHQSRSIDFKFLGMLTS